MPSPDADRLRHMRDAAAMALEMTAGHEWRLAPGFLQFPFTKMISMRNRLIHAYFDVDLDVVS